MIHKKLYEYNVHLFRYIGTYYINYLQIFKLLNTYFAALLKKN